jgi:tripartite-type tricarboxylate transporter receptor subunit TctC
MPIARVLLSLFACLFATATAAAAAPDYPIKPIQIVVPYGPGGAVDVVGRIIAEHMARTLGQPVVIQNRPGADANIGPGVVAQAAPDGYTLLASSTATIVNPLMERNLNWSTKDFVPVARYAEAPSALVVSASSGLTSLSGLLALAKATPEGLTAGVAGPGSPQTITTKNLARSAGIRLLYISYKGGVSYIPDLVSGTLAMLVAPANVIFRLVEDGRLTALATTGNRRSPVLPNVPTLAESGYPEATAVSWYGIHAPAGTPRPIIEKLAAAVHAATLDAGVKARLSALGAEISYLGPEDFRAFQTSELSKAEEFVETSAAK